MIIMVWQPKINIKEVSFMNDDSSLSHTRWNCKYHIVFVPKYRRKAIYGKLRAEIGAILRQLCAYKDVEIIEAHAMPDHIHILVKIPPFHGIFERQKQFDDI